MANEDSTKATYEELEQEMAQLKIDNEALESNLEAEEADNKRLKSELLRVRGLLQRYGKHDVDCRVPTLPCSCGYMQVLASGAESADIGKLDTPDKKNGYCGGCSSQFRNDHSCVHGNCLCECNPGSAETGGEKTAPQRVETGVVQFEDDWPGIFIRGDNAFGMAMAIQAFLLTGSPLYRAQVEGLQQLLASCNLRTMGDAEKAEIQFANFPRSSQNQTVSGGVEGAHEGTTADKSGSNCKHGVSQNQTTACGNCDEEMRGYSLSNLSDDSAPKPFEREFLESLLDTLRNSACFRREGMSCEEVNHQMAELESRLADSREPEKLNNAQKSAVKFLDYAIDMVESDCSTGAIVATLKAAKEALAESSLSSPPQVVCATCHHPVHGRDKCETLSTDYSRSSEPFFPTPHHYIRCKCLAASPELLPTQLDLPRCAECGGFEGLVCHHKDTCSRQPVCPECGGKNHWHKRMECSGK